MYWSPLAFSINLGMYYHDSVEVTFAGAVLEINQFYLSSNSQKF